MFRNTFKTFVLLAGLGGLLVAIGSIFGRGGAIIGLCLGLAIVGFSYWKSDSLAIRAARAVPAEEARYPEYFSTMRDLTQRADMPMPRLYVSPEQQPNAFATGRDPHHAAVAITEGLIAACTWDEIRGVLAHELAHVRNRDILIGSVAAAVATGISFIANMAMWGAMFGGGDDDDGGNPIALLATAHPRADRRRAAADGAVPKPGVRGRPLRCRADRRRRAAGPCAREAGGHGQRVPMDIAPAQAQAYIVNPLTGRQVSFANLFRTHPTTAERVARLRAG